MSENLHLVFSKPPEGMPDEEYNQWYDSHLAEILVVPGFVSANAGTARKAHRAAARCFFNVRLLASA